MITITAGFKLLHFDYLKILNTKTKIKIDKVK